MTPEQEQAIKEIEKSLDAQFKNMSKAAKPLVGVPTDASSGQQGAYSHVGILDWMPKQPNTGTWYDSSKDPVPPVQANVNTGVAPPKPKTRRQVSHNGKDWVDYRHLLDADDFECYAHRREV